jgi:hypothetical protein
MSLHAKQYREPEAVETEYDQQRHAIDSLRVSLREMVEKGEGCAACGTEGAAGCGCRYERAREVLRATERMGCVT